MNISTPPEMLILGSRSQITSLPCQALRGVPQCVPETSALSDPAMGGCQCLPLGSTISVLAAWTKDVCNVLFFLNALVVDCMLGSCLHLIMAVH